MEGDEGLNKKKLLCGCCVNIEDALIVALVLCVVLCLRYAVCARNKTVGSNLHWR